MPHCLNILSYDNPYGDRVLVQRLEVRAAEEVNEGVEKL
jgi:hypothetical protein